MRFVSPSDAHWTDEELIESLYGIGPENSHFEQCEECSSRRLFLLSNRRVIEKTASSHEILTFEFLAAQRRAVYEKLESRSVWVRVLGYRRWAPIVLTFLVVSGAVIYNRQHAPDTAVDVIPDAQLALEVSKMSQQWQAEQAAPLQGLFQ